MSPGPLVRLRAGGVDLILDTSSRGLPRILHWGADLGDVRDWSSLVQASRPPVAPSAVSVPVAVSLLPARADGYRGRPGLSGSREGFDWSTSFAVTDVAQTGPDEVVVSARDDAAGLEVRTELLLAPSGVLSLRHRLLNAGDTGYGVAELACVLPVPPQALELLDLTGRWCRERHPQRRRFDFGTWLREARRGRTGADATLVMVAGTPGFGWRTGELWGLHLGWSGNASTWAERNPTGSAVLGAAELLEPGEVMLAPGESYETPWSYAAYSDRGLDGLSAAFHGFVRARESHPRSSRPVVLNTWEAVYFDHRLDRLSRLAETAQRLGVERFVLDDGWFRRRRDDTAGLGDWYVDEDVWPQGLTPLIDHVRGLGMDFGLWVEPEMVNPDSDLFREHPDWILSAGGRVPVPSRHQQVLDLARPEAYAYIRERLHALLRDHDIAYLKWDHNRELVEPGHGGRPGVRAQTLAVYRLLDELRERHPRVEIESCASGGARVDLGILARTDRVWASDTNDALERQTIQRWTEVLLPPELVGAHVGPPRAHTTGRTHDLSFRIATALFGAFGIEWDVTQASSQEQQALADAIAFYKRLRGLLHGGEVVRADHPDPSATVHGVVAADRGEALFAFAQLATSALETPGPVRFPGLEPDRLYRVEPVSVGGDPGLVRAATPPWYDAGACTLSGRVLAAMGLQMPLLRPEQALLLHLTAQ